MRLRLATIATVLAMLLALPAASADAVSGPIYDANATWAPTNLPPSGSGQIDVQVRNIGDTTGTQTLTIVDQLPAGVTATAMRFEQVPFMNDFAAELCSGVGSSQVQCVLPPVALPSLAPAPGLKNGGLAAGPTGNLPLLYIDVEIDPGAVGSGTNIVTVSAADAPSYIEEREIPFGPTSAGFGILPGSYLADVYTGQYPAGKPDRKAGDHPFEQRVHFDLYGKIALNKQSNTIIRPKGQLKDAEVTLPRGFVGNPEATPKCLPELFAAAGASFSTTQCPSDTQVGYLNVSTVGDSANQLMRVPIYNLIPPKGVPADFGFNAATFVQGHIYPQLDPAQNYAIQTITPNISNLAEVLGSKVTFWGVPGDPKHDQFRAYPQQVEGKVLGAPWGSATIRPLLTNPMDCGFDNGGARIRLASYNAPDQFTPVEEWANPLNVEGCEDPRIRFEPEIDLQPTDTSAGAPTGLSVHLEVPQRNDEVSDATELYAQNGHVKGVATPPMKKAVVTLPEGMTLSPSAAQGLGTCSPAQIGLGTNDPVTCPDNSQYGTLVLHTPILPENSPPEGFIYVAKQGDNPFHNFLSIYLVIEEPERGILVKVPGRLDLDPNTGQITTTFDDLPQFPVSDMEMNFKGGARAGLVQPQTCGTKTIDAKFYSWSDPLTAHSILSSYEITRKPDGSPCANSLADRQFQPSLEAGTVSNAAGSYSPFVFRLTRTDDDQEFSQLGVTLPAGLSAKIAGIGRCSDAAIAQAVSRTAAGDGAIELSAPSCPASSQIGTTQVGAGVGVPLTYVPGKVYLAGPYQGAPLSMVVISPAVVGPFDIGVIAVRSAVRLDRNTTQVSVKTDPFPLIFQGIPVRIRDIRVKIDRPDTTLNPTSCSPMAVGAQVTGTGGDLASTADDSGVSLSDRFQAASCGSLGFKPKLSMRLFGGTHRGSHPRLKAVLQARPGDANIGRASVALPHSEFLAQSHIRTVCTRVQFAAHACPAGSIYGFAKAVTPLLDEPLSGPVYLRSSDNPLPDLVASLRGPEETPIEFDLVGRIDSVREGIRNTFDFVPDAPVTRFELSMQGGSKGLLENSRNLCSGPARVVARFGAQNGKAITLKPLLRNGCKKKKSARRR